MKSESEIVRHLAESIVDKMVKNCIRDLRKLKITLSGDSRLITTWDEICVQVQEEYSFYWDKYEETILNFVDSEEKKLEEFERFAIWYQMEWLMMKSMTKKIFQDLMKLPITSKVNC